MFALARLTVGFVAAFGCLAPVGGRRGLAADSPWVSFYGEARGVDLGRVAATFRLINIDVDPDTGNFTDAQIQQLRAGGRNQVISYLNVGACEAFRSYYAKAPPGHRSCKSSGALTTSYDGYADEKWANLANAAYRDLLVNHVAPRLAARGIDGFFLDNLEVVEHGATAAEGPCDEACAQGGLDLVWELRQRFPDYLIILQNATSDVTRLGQTHGVPFVSLLDGVSREEAYAADADPSHREELLRWKGLGFWVASEEYAGACKASRRSVADALARRGRADGVQTYVSDSSGGQRKPCFW